MMIKKKPHKFKKLKLIDSTEYEKLIRIEFKPRVY